MLRGLVLPLLTLAVFGCQPDRGTTDQVASLDEQQSAEEVDACLLLSPSMISVAANVPESELLESRTPLGCAYMWRGGSASLGPIYIFDSEEEAEAFFRETFRPLSSEEAALVTEQSLAFVEERVEAGSLGEADAHAMRQDAHLREEALQTINYETIGGIGDRALYDASIRPTVQPYIGEVMQAESNLAVLLRNVVFVVTGTLTDSERLLAEPSQRQLDENRDFTLALARRSVDEILRTGGG